MIQKKPNCMRWKCKTNSNILFTLDKIYNEKMEGNYDVTVLPYKRVSGSRIIKGELRDLRIIFCKILKNVVATPIFKGRP